MTAALTSLPVFGVPVESKALSGQDSLLSIVQMPAGIPVGTLAIGKAGAVNAALVGLGVVEQGIDFIGRGGFWTIVLIEALALYPIVYLNLSAALANVDPALEDAARGLGAGAFTRFRRITAPLLRPGAFAGAAIVFIWSFTELGTPLMLEYRTVTSVQVFEIGRAHV